MRVGVARRGALAAGLWLGALACLSPPPIVEEHQYGPIRSALGRVAVQPFTGAPGLADAASPVELIERFVTEALSARGVEMIPAQELRVAFAGREDALAQLPAAAREAGRAFGAKSILRGQVTRFRERVSPRPASVAFELSLHSAADGRRLWSGSFDETQVDLSADPRRARRYPGGGTRWLDATELAGWGARAAAEALVEHP